MTVQLFITMLAVMSTVCSLLTEAIKRATNDKFSDNLVVAIAALLVSVGGMIGTYIVLAIPFTAANIVAIVAMAALVWIGAMVGYDKVRQLIDQIFNKG